MPVQNTAASEDKYAPTHWGSTSQYEDLVVPSGQRCLVRKPGIESLLKSGILQNADLLSKIVQSEHVDRVKPSPKTEVVDDSTMDIFKNEGVLEDVIQAIDKIVCHTVVKPEVHMAPNDITNRKAGVVYTDMIDLNDRIFIMNFVVGGQRDLETFREGPESVVGSVGHESEDGSATE